MSVCSSSFKLPNLRTYSHHNHDVVVSPAFRYLSLRHSTAINRTFFKLQCVSNSDSAAPTTIDISANLAGESVVSKPRIGDCGGDGGDGGGGDGGAGGGGDGEGSDGDEKEFGPILKFEEVMKETEARGIDLPSDMLEAAKSTGIRKMFLLRYLDLQVNFLISSLLFIFLLFDDFI